MLTFAIADGYLLFAAGTDLPVAWPFARRGLARLALCFRRHLPALRHCRDKLVPDVANRADQRLVLRPELGAQPAYMHVDSPGAAEVLVSPDLGKQLRPGEHPSRMLREELQQLELLERQVERDTPDLG